MAEVASSSLVVPDRSIQCLNPSRQRSLWLLFRKLSAFREFSAENGKDYSGADSYAFRSGKSRRQAGHARSGL